MDLYVNNEPFTLDDDDADTVSAAMDVIRADDPDRLIVAIQLNGDDIPEDQVGAVLARPIAEPGRLDVELVSARKVSAEALGQAADILEQTRGHYVRIAELIACGKTADAMALLNECFSIFNGAEQSLRQTSQILELDLENAKDQAESPAAMIEQFGSLLKQIQDGLTRRDFVAVADLVEYDMVEITDGWQCMLVGLQQQVLA